MSNLPKTRLSLDLDMLLEFCSDSCEVVSDTASVIGLQELHEKKQGIFALMFCDLFFRWSELAVR
jgi:hypothetical protein